MYLNSPLQRRESRAIHCKMRRLLETLVLLHGLKIILLLQTPPKKKREYNKDLIYSLTVEALGASEVNSSYAMPHMGRAQRKELP